MTNEQVAYETIKRRLQKITIANGYLTDAGARVYDGWWGAATIDELTKDAESAKFPFIVLDEMEGDSGDTGGKNPAKYSSGGRYQWNVELQVSGFVRSPATVSLEADRLEEQTRLFNLRYDIRKALLNVNNADMAGLVDILVKDMTLDAREAGNRVSIVAYSVVISLLECI